MQSRNRNSFMVYNSSAYSYMRIVLIAAPFLCCALASKTQALWLYGVGIVMAIIAGYGIALASAKVVLDSKGITLIKYFQRSHIPWESIVFAENITLLPYGFSFPAEIICFSTQRHNPSKIRTSKSLPQLSKDFILIILNNRVRKAIAERIPSDVAVRLKIDPWVKDNSKRIFQSSTSNKWIILCVLHYWWHTF